MSHNEDVFDQVEFTRANSLGGFVGQFADWLLLSSTQREVYLRKAQAVTSGDSYVEKLTAERKSTHGNWVDQAALANELKERMRGSPNWNSLKPYQSEALDMIATKLSRILSGNPTEPDHWDDIAGYAYLGKGGHGQ